MNLRNIYLVFFSVVILSFQIFAQEFTFESVAGKYSAGHRFFGSTIILNKDGTYQQDSGGCTDEFFESGKYTINLDKITFHTEKSSRNRHGEEPIIENLDDKNSTEQMIFVKWEKRLYLMNEKELSEFVNAVNLGVEPRRTLVSDIFLGLFYLKSDESDFGELLQKVNGFPTLSNEWSSFLLKKHLIAVIIKIEKTSNGQTAIINKGSKIGLKVGMKLLINNQEPSLWSGATVSEVSPHSAKVSVSDKVKVGDKLSSRFIQKENYLGY